MCGIIGWVGREKAIGRLLFSCLKRLEYRGYDSYGFAVQDGELKVWKYRGELRSYPRVKAGMGIAHTRWATHGKPSKRNAHPHLSCDGKIAVVHNGIIENWKEIRAGLKGHKFRSETDTEVFVHLLEECCEKWGWKEGFKKAVEKLEGSWAILAIKAGEPEMLLARRKSPLVLGIAEDGIFASSDIPAFLPYTSRVVYLRDGDLAVISPKGFRVLGSRPQVQTVDWRAEEVEKGRFRHYMLKEIYQQAEVLKRVARADVEEARREIRKAGKIWLIGCGSSYHACLLGQYLLMEQGFPAQAVLASEFQNILPAVKKDLVLAVSQSGETADVLEACRVARERGCRIISILNVPGSSLMRESDSCIILGAGPELCVLSTKTFTSQVAVFFLLTGKLEKRRREIMELATLVYHLTSLSSQRHLKKLAERLKRKRHLYVLGSGLRYPLALEAALKIKEVSYIHAEGFAAKELKHGPLALISKGTPCLAFLQPEILPNLEEVRARGGWIIGIGPENPGNLDFFIKTPKKNDMAVLLEIIPVQLLAYQLAVLKGLNPDKPRNLAKSVTVK